MNLTIHSFESEDHILFCGIADDGLELDIEQCQRLFSLTATICHSRENGNPEKHWIPDQVRNDIEQIALKQKAGIFQNNAERNGGFFDDEMEKLDKWADDVKSSIELELKEFDRDIKARKTEAKKILKLEEKLAVQKEIKDMEKKRNALRQNLFHAQDEVDKRKENLIEEIEVRLKQKIETNELFTIKWKLI